MALLLLDADRRHGAARVKGKRRRTPKVADGGTCMNSLE